MEKEFDFSAEWVNHLLQGLENGHDKECALKNCADFHYRMNQMDDAIEPYIGNLEGFISYLENTYGWIVTCSEDGGSLLIDENKDVCVCPIVNKVNGKVSPLLCECSSCYAKKMFSKVCRKEVSAVVKQSILRGGKSCIYEIKL